MLTISAAEREAFINGLRALADYLDTYVDIPVPVYGTRIAVSAREVEDGGDIEVMDAAVAMICNYKETANGGMETSRAFGPVVYKVFALPKESLARFEAESTYRGCITPDQAA